MRPTRAEAVKLGHANTDALSSLGTLALSEQEDVNAMQYFTQAIALKSNNGRAWLGKAMAEMLQRKLPEAEISFKEAIRFMPKHLGTWQALAWCQIAQRKLDDAEATVETSLAIDQNFAESHGALAVLHILRGQPELAQIPTMRALWLDKQSFTGLYAQALLLQLQGKTSDSETLVQGLLDHPLLPDQTSLRQLLVRYLSKS